MNTKQSHPIIACFSLVTEREYTPTFDPLHLLLHLFLNLEGKSISTVLWRRRNGSAFQQDRSGTAQPWWSHLLLETGLHLRTSRSLLLLLPSFSSKLSSFFSFIIWVFISFSCLCITVAVSGFFFSFSFYFYNRWCSCLLHQVWGQVRFLFNLVLIILLLLYWKIFKWLDLFIQCSPTAVICIQLIHCADCWSNTVIFWSTLVALLFTN